MEKFDLKIFTDTDCDIYIDGSFVTKLTRGAIWKTSLADGEYIVQAKTPNPALNYRKVFTLCKNAVLEISFEAMLQERKELMANMKLHPFIASGAGLKGFMDIKSRAVAIPAVYDMVYSFNFNGLAIVKKDGKYGMINKYGEEVIPIEYAGLRIPSPKEEPDWACITDCVLIGEKGDGVLDYRGNWKLMPDEGYKLEHIHSVRSEFSFSHYYLFVNSAGERQIFDGDKFISPRSFVQVRFYEDVIVFKKLKADKQSYHYGVMNYGGYVWMTGFGYISAYQNGYAWAKMGEKEGWIDKFGKFAFIPDNSFDRCGPFDGKLALVRKGDKVGFIDTNNKEVIPFVYDAASPFTEDRAIVSRNGLIGMIDSTGREVCPCIYEVFRKPNCMAFPLAIVKLNGKYGCINKDGELQVPCVYKDLWLIEKDFIAVKNEDNLWGFINSRNEQLIPFEYGGIGKRGCHQFNSNQSFFWETIPSWEKDIYNVCKRTLNGCVPVFEKGYPQKKTAGIVNKTGLIVPFQYKINAYSPFSKSTSCFSACAIDSNEVYHIFSDGTVLPVSLEMI